MAAASFTHGGTFATRSLVGKAKGAPGFAIRRLGGNRLSTKATNGSEWWLPPTFNNQDKIRQELLVAIAESFERDVLPQWSDLIEPWFEPEPQRLTDTLPPTKLAEPGSQWIEICGIPIHYKEACYSEGGPVVVMLHGWNGSCFSFRDVMQGVAERVGGRAIAFDRPPFGLSGRPTEMMPDGSSPYSGEQAVRFTLGIVDQLVGSGAEVILVGHSAGCIVANDIARDYPNRVSSLVLVSPALSAPPSEDKEQAGPDLGTLLRLIYLRTLLDADGPALNYVRRQVLRRRDKVAETGDVGYASNRPVPEEVVEAYTKPLRANDWDKATLLQIKGAIGSVGSGVGSYEHVSGMRVTVVQGDEDKTTPSRGVRKLYAALEAAGCIGRYVELQGVGHLPVEEEPARFLEAFDRHVG